jgi:uncharacterized tellurite resistance protein B-like protein
MTFVAKLIGLISTGPSRTGEGAAAVSEEKLALAALLVHVARVDGEIEPRERARLHSLLASRLEVPESDVESLIDEADRFDREIGDVPSLLELLGHHFDDAERRQLLLMAYGVATADGPLGEFEDDLVWRLGHLLAFNDAQIEAIRVEAARGPADGTGPGVVGVTGMVGVNG